MIGKRRAAPTTPAATPDTGTIEAQGDERRQAQARLEAERARYFDLYDQAPVGYCAVSEQGLILGANLTAATLLGAPRSELIGKRLSWFILEGDRDLQYQQITHLFEIEAADSARLPTSVRSFELRMVKADGAPFWADVDATLARDADGTAVCGIVIRDITERKRADEVEAFLARSSGGTKDEPFWNALARYLAHGLDVDFVCISHLDADGLCARTLAVWCDGQFEKNVTCAQEHTPCRDVFGQAARCFPVIMGQLFPGDQMLRGLRPEHCVGATLRSDTGQPVGLIAAIGRRPLANRSQAEATLALVTERAARELERQLLGEALRERIKERDCLYAVADLIARNTEGSLETILQGTAELLPGGLYYVESACARITLNDQEFKTASFRQTAWRQAADILVRGRPVGMVEVCYLDEQPLRDEGPFVWEELRLINAVAERLGTEADRRRADAELREAHDELERRVESRTAQLAEANAALRAEVSRRAYVEERLRKLARAIEQSNDSVVLTDRDGVIEYVNAAFERMTGFSSEEAVGATPRLLNSGRHDRELFERLWSTILSGETFRAVFINRTKDGREYQQDEIITPLRDSHGNVTHFVSTGRDVTKSRRIEEALRRLNDRLEHEATRIASALHDEAGQFLTAAHIALAAVERGLSPTARAGIRDVKRHLDEVETQLRRLAHELRPRILEDMGLADALKFLADGVAKRTGTPISVEGSLERRCGALAETALYRLVQEGLTNMAKHARATRCTVMLAQDGETVRCSVRDDGVGFDPSSVVARRDEFGLGLLGIQDRLEVVDGALEIISAPGEGTELRAIVPLES